MSRTITVTVSDEFYDLLAETATTHNQRIEDFSARALTTGTHSRYLVDRDAQYRSIIQLAEAGLNDVEISAAIGLDRVRIGELRRVAVVPSVGRTLIDPKKVRRLWKAGFTDREIAAALGFSKQGITGARKRANITAATRTET